MTRTTPVAVAVALAIAGAALAADPAPKLQRQETPSPHRATIQKEQRAVLDWKLSVGSVAVAPVDPQGIKENSHVMLDIKVENSGSDASPGRQTLQVKCTVVSGGPQCPVADTTRTLPSIQGGGVHATVLVAAQGAKPGDYQVTFALQGDTRRAASRNLHVYSATKLQKAPAGTRPLRKMR